MQQQQSTTNHIFIIISRPSQNINLHNKKCPLSLFQLSHHRISFHVRVQVNNITFHSSENRKEKTGKKRKTTRKIERTRASKRGQRKRGKKEKPIFSFVSLLNPRRTSSMTYPVRLPRLKRKRNKLNCIIRTFGSR